MVKVIPPPLPPLSRGFASQQSRLAILTFKTFAMAWITPSVGFLCPRSTVPR